MMIKYPKLRTARETELYETCFRGLLDRGAVYGEDDFELLLSIRSYHTLKLLVNMGAIEVSGPLLERGLLFCAARGDLHGLRLLLEQYGPMPDASFFQEHLLIKAMRSQSHHIVKVTIRYYYISPSFVHHTNCSP